MNNRQTYAMILGEKVLNISLFANYEDANRITRAVYGDAAFAVNCDQYACEEGDLYHDNIFWQLEESGDEKEIPYIPTSEQQIHILNQQITDTESTLIKQFELNQESKKNITDLQLIIAEIFENKEI